MPLPHSWVLLPPKSLRSRFGDSERFSPLQREGDRFTAEGEGEGRREGKDGRWGERERGRQCCLLRSGRPSGNGNPVVQPGPHASPQRPAAPSLFSPTRSKYLRQELDGPTPLRLLLLPGPLTGGSCGRGGPPPLWVLVCSKCGR